MPHQHPIDLTAANRIARGKSQKRWLSEMLTPTGLDPNHGRYRADFRRIMAFADKLVLAGYATEMLQMAGPFLNWRIVITTGYEPVAAPLLAAIRANTCRSMSAGSHTVSQCELLAWVASVGPEVVRAATSVAPWFTGSLEELLTVAPGIALGQTLSATV